MMHDFALTGKYVVLLDLPVTFSVNAVTEGKELPYVWNPEHQARVGLLPRDGSSPVRWIEIEPCWVFHCLNAYDDSGRVVVDLCQYNRVLRRLDAVGCAWAGDAGQVDNRPGGRHGHPAAARRPRAGVPAGRRPDHLPATPLRLQRGHRRGHPGHHGYRRLRLTTRSPTRSCGMTWPAAPSRHTSSAATPPSARRCSLPPLRTPPRTTAISWPSCTTPTAAQLTWSSSPRRTSPPNQSPASTCQPGSRSASTAAGSPPGRCRPTLASWRVGSPKSVMLQLQSLRLPHPFHLCCESPSELPGDPARPSCARIAAWVRSVTWSLSSTRDT